MLAPMVRPGRAGVLLLGLVLALARPAGTGPPTPLPNIGPPLLLRLQGVTAATPGAAAKVGFRVVSLGFLGDDATGVRYLGVTDARTVGGDQFLNGKDVLEMLAPFQPMLLVTGPPDLVARLRDVPPGSRVEIEGLVERAARTYYLRSVRDIGPRSRLGSAHRVCA